MKIALPTFGSDLTGPLEARFGRAPRFLVYDFDADSFELVDNTRNMQAAQGAGVLAGQCVAEAGAQALILRHCGPKAFRTLEAAGVQIYMCDALTVGEALERFKAGKLERCLAPDSEGH